MSEPEQLIADLWATGITRDAYPTALIRPRLDALGIVPATALRSIENRTRVTVGGVVTHRQRPATARGVTFLNLEDETGMVNVIVDEVVWKRHRRVARESGGLLIRGMLERADGVINIAGRADRKTAARPAHDLPRLPMNSPQAPSLTPPSELTMAAGRPGTRRSDSTVRPRRSHRAAAEQRPAVRPRVPARHCQTDPQPGARPVARPVPLDDQRLSRLQPRLHVLLRPPDARAISA